MTSLPHHFLKLFFEVSLTSALCRLINFNFHRTMWQPFVPNILPSSYHYTYPAWYLSHWDLMCFQCVSFIFWAGCMCVCIHHMRKIIVCVSVYACQSIAPTRAHIHTFSPRQQFNIASPPAGMFLGGGSEPEANHMDTSRTWTETPDSQSLELDRTQDPCNHATTKLHWPSILG